MRTRSLAGPLCASALLLVWGSPRPVSSEGADPPAPAETVFTADGGLGQGWQDWGWAPRSVAAGAPARLDLSAPGGWILARPGLAGRFGAVRLRLLAGSPWKGLELALDGPSAGHFPRVALGAEQLVSDGTAGVELAVPMRALNPAGRVWDRLLLRSRVPLGVVAVESISLTAGGEEEPPLPAEAPSQPFPLVVQCRAEARPISPLVYGIAYDPRREKSFRLQWQLGAAARRWGGNPSSRYNWEHGRAWNTASDWFFTNVNYTGDPGYTWERFLDDQAAHSVGTALTVPMLGWVAKDTRAYSFPVSVYGPQQRVAPENPDAGNGVRRDGRPLNPLPPSQTSVAQTPDGIGRWVEAIRRRGSLVDQYILDNEPMLWHVTHRDVHPEPATYDEILERTLAYAAAVRQADPEAVVAGPALWGWPAYNFSAADQVAGFRLKPDRRAHADVPFLPWWLRQVRAAERRVGRRLLDVVDVHLYPQGEGISGGAARTDPATNARRIRSTRSLWDPTYLDESWIDERVQLVPRLQAWIDENAPGLGISIGEWNFGASEHMSGGLATAEALGRYGALGLRSAFFWDYPGDATPAFWAFRAYRDFDGEGGRFQDFSLPTEGSGPSGSLFASRNAAGDRLVAVLLSFEPEKALAAEVDLDGCGAVLEGRAFAYDGGPQGFVAAPLETEPGRVRRRAAPYSISVLDLKLRPAAAGQ